MRGCEARICTNTWYASSGPEAHFRMPLQVVGNDEAGAVSQLRITWLNPEKVSSYIGTNGMDFLQHSDRHGYRNPPIWSSIHHLRELPSLVDSLERVRMEDPIRLQSHLELSSDSLRWRGTSTKFHAKVLAPVPDSKEVSRRFSGGVIEQC